MITLFTERTFRQTPGVHFADISVPGANGLDLVEHFGPSVSPPNRKVLGGSVSQWYVHKHQDDNNRCVKGHRLFELFCDAWELPHWFVMLDEKSGALHIPAGCLHRSYSGVDGSLLLNHAVRSEFYDERQEFNPVIHMTAKLYAPQYYNCTAEQVRQFIQTGTFD